MEVFPFLTKYKGKFSFITPPSWMFLNFYEPLRNDYLSHYSIESLLHLSRGIFGADFGSVCTSFSKQYREEPTGTYYKLVERTFQEFHQSHLEILFLKSINNPNFKFDFKRYSKEDIDIDHSDDGLKTVYTI